MTPKAHARWFPLAGALCFFTASAFSAGAEEALFPGIKSTQPQAQPQPQPQPVAQPEQPPAVDAPPADPNNTPMFAPLNAPASVPSSPPAQAASAASAAQGDVDPSLTTFQAAVECATAILMEQHKVHTNVITAAFKAGLCTGKVQTYMLTQQAQNPACFPKISLDEGVQIFTKWADAHPADKDTLYLDGMQKAFADAVPCMKK